MLHSSSLPTVPADFIEEVKKRHPPLTIGPETDLNSIMFDAGKQSMIKWLERMLPKTTMQGQVNRHA